MRQGSTTRRAGAAIVGAVVLVVGTATTALAHDELTGSTPEQGATVSEGIDEVRLEFSGAIADVGSLVEVTGPEGEATQGEPEVDGTAVVQPLADDLTPGEYAVLWRVTSEDGHPISGELGYTLVGDESPTTSAEPTSADPDSPDTGAATATSSGGDDAAQTTGSDHAANTAAAPAQGDESEDSGPAWWVWGVLALAVLTLGALGAVAVRRR